jgi:membrane protein YqaA with SNARE-associated domain
MFLGAIAAALIEYGIAGLAFSSFLSSLVFIPGYASFLIPLFVGLHANPWQMLFAISIGAIAGEAVNYYLGIVGSKYILHLELKKAKKWLSRWGEMSVFIVNLIPLFPADVVNTLIGFLKMDFKTYMISMSLGKIIQYSLLIFGAELLFKVVSII